ncbi:uncharacterized protein LOC135830086 [Sycon ciliatum]|uniref:uncharacterized protein LOC135830086 n=1 Tax=Sycon ciliatum TaxID=27933 RepID=UPI0031F6CD15
MACRYDVRPPSFSVMLVLGAIVVLMIFPVHGQTVITPAPTVSRAPLISTAPVATVTRPPLANGAPAVTVARPPPVNRAPTVTASRRPLMSSAPVVPTARPPPINAAPPPGPASMGRTTKPPTPGVQRPQPARKNPDTCGEFAQPTRLTQASVALPRRLYDCKSRPLGTIPYGQYRRQWHSQSWTVILPVSEANRPGMNNRLAWTASIAFSEPVQVGRVNKGRYENNPSGLYSVTHNFSGLASFSMFGGFRAPLLDFSYEFFADKLLAVLHPVPMVRSVRVSCDACATTFRLEPVGAGARVGGPGAVPAVAPAGRRTDSARGRNAPQFRNMAPGVVFEPAGRGNEQQNQGPDAAMIAGVIIGALVLAGVGLIVVYVWWKRRVRSNQRKHQESMISDRRQQQMKPHLVTTGVDGGAGTHANTMDRKPTFRDVSPAKPVTEYDSHTVPLTSSGKYDPIPPQAAAAPMTSSGNYAPIGSHATEPMTSSGQYDPTPTATTRLTTTSSSMPPKDSYNSLQLTVSSRPATQPSFNYEAELYQNHMPDEDPDEVENALQPGPGVIAELSSELYMRQKFARQRDDESFIAPRQRTSTISADMKPLSIKSTGRSTRDAKPDRPPRNSDNLSSSSRMSSLKKFVQRLPPEGVAALNQLQRPKTPVSENPLDRDGYIIPDVKSPSVHNASMSIGGHNGLTSSPSSPRPALPRKPDGDRPPSRLGNNSRDAMDMEDEEVYEAGFDRPDLPPRTLAVRPQSSSRRRPSPPPIPSPHRNRTDTESTTMSRRGTLQPASRTQTQSTLDSGFDDSNSALTPRQQRKRSRSSDVMSTADSLDDYQNPLDARTRGDGGPNTEEQQPYENVSFRGDSSGDNASRHDYVEPLDKLSVNEPSSSLGQIRSERMSGIILSFDDDPQAYSEVEMDEPSPDSPSPAPLRPASAPLPRAKPPKPAKSSKVLRKGGGKKPTARVQSSKLEASMPADSQADQSFDMDIVYDNVSELGSETDCPDYEMTGKPASLANQKDIDGIYTYAGLPRTRLDHVRQQKQRPRTAVSAMTSLRKKKHVGPESQ